jgi:hypothetical protein
VVGHRRESPLAVDRRGHELAGRELAVQRFDDKTRTWVAEATTTAAADGSFRTAVTIPPGTEPGTYTHAASSGGEVLGLATIRVLATGIGGLPFTDSDVVPGLTIGAGLIVAGGLLLLAVRRRRRSTA